MPNGNSVLAFLGLIMGVLILTHRADYAQWAARQWPSGMLGEDGYRLVFLLAGLGISVGGLLILLRLWL